MNNEIQLFQAVWADEIETEELPPGWKSAEKNRKSGKEDNPTVHNLGAYTGVFDEDSVSGYVYNAPVQIYSPENSTVQTLQNRIVNSKENLKQTQSRDESQNRYNSQSRDQSQNRDKSPNRDKSQNGDQSKNKEGGNTRDQEQNREETQNLDHVQNNDLPDTKKKKKLENNESRQDKLETRQGMIKKFSKKLVGKI